MYGMSWKWKPVNRKVRRTIVPKHKKVAGIHTKPRWGKKRAPGELKSRLYSRVK
jgi:hypothetical protein